LDVAENSPIPIICGPTAAGKTSLALEYAAEFPIEIVSADSRQIIKHLDIGTAKPTPQERAQAPMHLIDIIEPGERYSAFQFISDATRVIGEILGRGNIPVVVGGTGLYLRALVEGVVEIESDDMSIRDQLEKEMEEEGPENMHDRLMKIDPLEAARIHPNNRRRVIRALEIFYLTGKSKSEITVTGAYSKPEHRFEYYCLVPDREKLYAAINGRVDEMMQAGLPEEIERLAAQGRKEDIRRANVIGYNELLSYVDGGCSLEEAVSLIKQNTRRFAKRQITWFRGQRDCRFYADKSSIRQALDLR
jgi:tRNA dimethylallyltransferase